MAVNLMVAMAMTMVMVMRLGTSWSRHLKLSLDPISVVIRSVDIPTHAYQVR